MLETVIVRQVNTNGAYLNTRAYTTSCGESPICAVQRPGDEFPNIVADVASGKIVADEKDGIGVEGDLRIEGFDVDVGEACNK